MHGFGIRERKYNIFNSEFSVLAPIDLNTLVPSPHLFRLLRNKEYLVSEHFSSNGTHFFIKKI